MNLDFGGLQAGGSAGDFALDLQGAGGLQRDAASPWLGFETQLPAARGGLLDAAGDVREGEGAFLVAGFEIDAAVVKFDFLQVIAGAGGALRAVGNGGASGFGLSRWQPSFEVPAALFVANENEAGSQKRDGSEIEMPAEKAEPADISRHAVRAQKVFVAEGGIFVNADAFDVHPGEGKNIHGKTASFDGPPERSFEVGEEVGAHAAGPEEERESQLRKDQQDRNSADPFSVCAKARHEVEVSQKWRGKNRGGKNCG